MIRRLQLRSFDMAERAANRRVDLVVANEAVGHREESRFRRPLRILDAVVAGQTWVARVETAPQIAGWRQVCPFVDRRGDDRRDVAQLQVRLVTERLQLGGLGLLSKQTDPDAEDD